MIDIINRTDAVKLTQEITPKFTAQEKDYKGGGLKLKCLTLKQVPKL